jgi:hypothetical protein
VVEETVLFIDAVRLKEHNELVEVHDPIGHILGGEVSVHLDENAPLFERVLIDSVRQI